MSACHEFHFIECFSRSEVDGSMTPWDRSDVKMIGFPDEARSALDNILELYDSNEAAFSIQFEVTFRKMNQYPWAIIAFDREYRLAGHLTSIRQNLQGMPFFSYKKTSSIEPDDFVPGVGGIVVMEKEALAEIAANGSPLIAEAWNILQAKPTNKHWLCLPDPLPESWVKDISRDDNERYLANNC